MGLIKATFHGSAEDIDAIIEMAQDSYDVVMVGKPYKSRVWINEYCVELRMKV